MSIMIIIKQKLNYLCLQQASYRLLDHKGLTIEIEQHRG